MSAEDGVGKGPNKEKTLDLPYICGLVPDRWSDQLVIYGEGYLKVSDGQVISFDPKVKKSGLSPAKPLFGRAVGWQVVVNPPEEKRRMQTVASFERLEKGSEEKGFCNVWWWDGDSSVLRILAAKEGRGVELYREPVAVIPVPEKPHAKLPEEKGGVLIIPIARLGNEHTVKILEGFLRPRFQGW